MLHLDFGQQFKSAPQGSPKPKLRIVSREPLSPVASFLLGWTAGIATALALFVTFVH